MRQPSPWNLVMLFLLVLLVAAGLRLTLLLCSLGPTPLPEARMRAEWMELERLAAEHPYRESRDGER